MPIGSSTSKEARGAALDAFYGDNASSSAPTQFHMALFVGDPTGAGTELAGTGGYARVILGNNSTTFPDALPTNSYAKLVGIPVRFPLSTAAWSGTPDHWAFFDDDGNLCDSGTITGSAAITAAGQLLRFDTNTIEITVA